MVTQRNAKPPTDVWQLRRVDSPLLASELDGAGKWRLRRAQPVPCTAREKDAPVERRVVSGQELCVLDPGAQRWPEILEGGRVTHVLPTHAVDPGERERRRRRTDEVRSRGDDPAIAAGGETDRARAIAARRGGLEVDGDKGTHRASPYHTKDGKLAVETQLVKP